jgi:hypothetical protein
LGTLKTEVLQLYIQRFVQFMVATARLDEIRLKFSRLAPHSSDGLEVLSRHQV